MKYLLVVISILLLSGCASSGHYAKCDGKGAVLELHIWETKGNQNTKIPNVFETDTKSEPIKDFININAVKD